MNRRAIDMAYASLMHPITLGAIGVMLVNDHVLRVLWPSWVTGKISDAAWLVIVPPLLALVIGLVVLRHERKVGLAAILITGAAFVLIKVTPVAGRIVTPVGVFGTRADASDLLVLPALGIAWLVWERSGSRRAARIKWAAIPLAGLVLMADAGMPDNGLACMDQQNGTVYVEASNYTGGVYRSEDGGLTWVEGGDSLYFCDAKFETWTLEDSEEVNVVYRFSDQRIERSEDAGRTWMTEVNLIEEEARFAYSRRQQYQSNPGPLNALIDEATGNVIVAMGHDGVLVRTQDGEWQWIEVGPYQRDEMASASDALGLIIGELLLAVFLIPLVIGVLSTRVSQKRVLAIILTMLAALAWIGAVISSPVYTAADNYISIVVIGIIAAAGLLALAAGALGANRFIGANPKGLGIAAGIGGGLAAVVAAAYLVWVFTGAISYGAAMIAALVIAVAGTAVGVMMIRRSPPVEAQTEES